MAKRRFSNECYQLLMKHRAGNRPPLIKMNAVSLLLNFLSYEKTAEKNYLKAVPAWLSLILAAHRVQL